MSRKSEFHIEVDLSPENLALIELEARRLRNAYLAAAVRGGVARLKALFTDRAGVSPVHDSALTRGA
jgi:hypothetical protein